MVNIQTLGEYSDLYAPPFDGSPTTTEQERGRGKGKRQGRKGEKRKRKRYDIHIHVKRVDKKWRRKKWRDRNKR